MSGEDGTLLITNEGGLAQAFAPRFSVEVVRGPDAGASASSAAGPLVIG